MRRDRLHRKGKDRTCGGLERASTQIPLLKISPAEDGENADVTLPKLSEGQGFPNSRRKSNGDTTTPPKPCSEVPLSAMERAGNGHRPGCESVSCDSAYPRCRSY